MARSMIIVNLTPDDETRFVQVAELWVDAFRDHLPLAWPDLPSALEEVRASLQPGHLSRVAVNETGQVLGWTGGIPQYDGHAEASLQPVIGLPWCDSRSRAGRTHRSR